MESLSDSLKWTAQLHVAPRTTKLVGDKIILPQSALEALLAAAPVVAVQNGASRNLTSHFDPFNPLTYAAERLAREQLSDRQQQLPHPLTFRIVNPRNGRAVYAGIREFSASENEIGLSSFLTEALGLLDGSSPQKSTRSNTPSGDVEMVNGVDEKAPLVTVHAKQLPKGSYVRLRPLEAGYDPEDWKSLLERYLRDNFTTLTNGELLDVPGARHEHFRFLVDKFEPEGDGICIVDTDLEVDIEALNEEQARESLSRRLAKSKRAPGTEEGSSAGGLVTTGAETLGQVLAGEYVDYELKEWDRSQGLEVDIHTDQEDGLINVFASPFSAHQRSQPREDEHVFADLSGRPSKRLRLSPTNIDQEAESLYISIHAWKESSSQQTSQPVPYTLKITSTPFTADFSSQVEEVPPLAIDEVICKNCLQHIPKRTLPLHEAFCYRNNILCPKCSNVFLKSSQAWKDHWHCHLDSEHGNTPISRIKHDSTFHPPSPIQCTSCDFQAFNLPILAHHRTTSCPGKEILCQFCHLVVPQQSPDDPSFTDPEVTLSGLTPHELVDGARTTECHLCAKIVRLRDMKTHLRFHDRDRVLRPTPTLCINGLCGRSIKTGDEGRVIQEQLGLCNECFGPLYVASYDPEGKALRRRIERRLLQLLIGGCGKSWCANTDRCKTGHKNATGQDRVMSAKDALPLLKPVMEALAKGDTSALAFCVDEASQRRRSTAELMAAEGEYSFAWCVRALEEMGDLGRAREWLVEQAPRIGEVLT
jgi:Ubiquitin fusion degradation protein UFD1